MLDQTKTTDKGKSSARSEQKPLDLVRVKANKPRELQLDPTRDIMKGGMENEGSSSSSKVKEEKEYPWTIRANKVKENLKLQANNNKGFTEKMEKLKNSIKNGEGSTEKQRKNQEKLNIMEEAEKEYAKRAKDIRSNR